MMRLGSSSHGKLRRNLISRVQSAQIAKLSARVNEVDTDKK